MCTDALLSRSTVFEFKAVSPEEVEPAVAAGTGASSRSARPCPWTGRRVCPGRSPPPAAAMCARPSTRWSCCARQPCPTGREAAADHAGRCSSRWPSAAPCATTGAATTMYDIASALMKSLPGQRPGRGAPLPGPLSGGGGSDHPLPAAAVLRQRGCGDGLPPGGLHCEGLRGHRHAAGAAGGPAAPGPGGYPAGHGPQVQQRDRRHRQRPGRM